MGGRNTDDAQVPNGPEVGCSNETRSRRQTDSKLGSQDSQDKDSTRRDGGVRLDVPYRASPLYAHSFFPNGAKVWHLEMIFPSM